MKTHITSELLPAIELLKRGELVAFPTETVYGLGGSIFQKGTVEKIFAVKGRPLDNPLIVHIASLSQALPLIDSPPPSFFRLAHHFWPGPLTLVVARHPSVPSLVSAGQPSLAIRMPNHPLALRLIKEVQEPLAAPSANVSGRPSPTSAEDVREDLQGKIPLILNGGPCQIGIESTVLSLLQKTPVLLRPGSIRCEELEAFLGCDIAWPKASDPPLSPGMKYRHYAPKALVRLLFDAAQLKGPFTLSRTPLPGKKSHPLTVQTLYSLLREADRLGVSEIEVYCDEVIQRDPALMNRLLRASGQLG